RMDNLVRVCSSSVPGPVQEYQLGHEHPVGNWLDHVQGCTRLLREDGQPVRGFDAAISSDVPLGSGLSSSASFSVSLLTALRMAFGLELDDLQLALLGQRIENQFVGAQVGVMDPMACCLGEEGAALFIDTRTLQHRRVALPAGADLVVINSGVAHEHAAG